MKLKNNTLFIAALSALWSCVQMNEDDLGGGQELEKLPLSVTATIEADSQTKTALEGSLSDASMRTVWMPSDNIGIVAVRSNMGENEPVNEFVTDVESASETAVFHGAIPMVAEYYAFYPYSETLKNSKGTFIFTIPQEQRYVAGSFDPKAAPMVAKAARGESFDFQNLCGLLALQLTGEETVSSITFLAEDISGNNVPVSGTYGVNMTYEADPVIELEEGQTSVILLCDTPVQLSQQATPFYFVLPPAEYNNFRIIIRTSDDKIMIKEGTKPLTVTRSHVKPTSALDYVENVYLDLSEEGWANCYIVSGTGSYEFDSDVIGNGEFGLIAGANFHTEDVTISPVSAELLWEDRPNLLLGVELKDNKVRFYSTGKEGNALIVVKDADGNILWSWHIWCTDVPVDQTYVNSIGTFTVQDRNLGATRADRGVDDQWKESMGVYYQWGRKDPFVRGLYTRQDVPFSVQESVSSPDVYAYNGTIWNSDSNSNLWSRTRKTIYDPCPLGYRVPSKDIWHGMTKTGGYSRSREEFNVSGDYDQGWHFLYDGQQVSWYPSTNYISNYGDYSESSHSYMWSSDLQTNLGFGSGWIEPATTSNFAYGFNVRCAKDEDADAALVLVEGIDNVTSSSATLCGYAYSSGRKEVKSRGFVYGVDKKLAASDVVTKECGAGQGSFSIDLNELSGMTKYYVRAFAKVGDDTIYSEVKSFTTADVSGVTDLSAEGTANCYIISQAGTYKFNATVKGNSTEPVSAETVAVVWETLNTSDAVTQGAVIASVALENGYVTFTTPADFTPGNALIAVKSAGKILWSWHIWAVDADMELNAQLYQNGALMMDRNLGALSVTPGDVRSYGLFYQWGRKDPCVGCGNITENTHAATYPEDAIQFVDNNSNYNNYNYAEAHPSHFIKGSGWNDDLDYWGIHKTMYDPCPYGWRIPDLDTDAWGGFSTISYINNGAFFNPPLSEPAAYYPYSGYMDYYGNLYEANQVASVWYATRTRILRVASDVSLDYGASEYNGSVIRCMKDAEFTVYTGAKEDIYIGALHLGIPGELTIDDGTAMDVIGVVYSADDSTPKLGKANCHVVNADTVSAGEFTVTVTGLKPKTRYWVRTYARGGHNLRYGEIREVWTNAAADNEGYGSEDFEW